MKIHIYHTNDIHANYENLENIAAYLKENLNEDDLYLDSGDFLDLKDLIVQADKGVSAIEILNSLKLDAMTVGNNEIDLGYEDLLKTAAKAPMVCLNLTDNEGKKLPTIPDYRIIEKANRRFLVIGIAPYYSRDMSDNHFNGFFTLYGLQVHPSIEAIQNILNENKGLYDFSILLAHNGLTVEKNINREIPQIDLVLGGHSHSLEAEGNYNQTGMYAEHLGRITLDILDHDIKIICNELLDLPVKKDEEFEKMLETKKKKADEILSRDLCACEELPFDAYKECPLMNFVCDSLLDSFKADFAIMHNGIANFSLNLPVSRKSLIECFPSKLNPTVYSLKGKEIKEAILLSFNEEHIHQDGKGAGFRGTTLGTLSYSHNVKITTNPFNIYIDEKPLKEDKIYTIVTDDYLQRGTGYPSLKKDDKDAFWHVWFIRDLMEHTIQKKKIYDTSKIKRIQ